MNLSIKTMMAFVLVVLCASNAFSADLLKPKYEMRSVWLATVEGIDWPSVRDQQMDVITSKNLITSPGNVADIGKQKQLMVTMLDSLAKNNVNCVNFQVRSRCDAMYKSAYEPWSADLVAVRGMDPGYDPLQFVVEECHKRGMECHAWVNPYRYELTGGEWGENDYRADHPDWIMDFKGKSILNPGMPEVVQRITDVCKDIISNYDVDGILYDDYFYIPDYSDASGNKESYALDKDLYDKYIAEGGVLSQGDWRRENVNTMIKSVYDMIQEVKPWVRFGLSPAGCAGSVRYIADKYGLTVCPGIDWQYDDIHSDPLAWLSRRTLDFISPQVYWTIGDDILDYSKITPWWSETTAKFKRQLFVSHFISPLRLDSTEELASGANADAFSYTERNIMAQTKALGSEKTFREYADQVRINRESSRDNAPGSIFFSAKHMYWMAPQFGHYLKNTVFTRPAILPAMTYKAGNNPGKVKNIALNEGKLSWEGYDNVRYTVYAVPASVAQSEFNCEADYLLGTSYATAYEIPEGYGSGYQFAICVLDRVGNEYAPVFMGAGLKVLDAPELTAPANGSMASGTFDFVWSAVEGATGYIVEMAYDAKFKNMFRTYPVADTKFSSANIEDIKSNTALYWRVRSTGVNCSDGLSDVFSMTLYTLSISSPANNSITSLTPAIRWNHDYNGDPCTIEIATNADFTPASIVHTGENSAAVYETKGEYIVPPYTLKSSTRYYIRLTRGVLKSDIIAINTHVPDVHVPVVVSPCDGSTMEVGQRIIIEPQQGIHSFIIEVAASNDFPARNKYTETLKDFNTESVGSNEMKINGKNLVEYNTYYLRVDATYINDKGVTTRTGKSDVISFTYIPFGSVEDNLSGTEVRVKGVTDPVLAISAPGSTSVEVRVYNAVGVQEEILYDGEMDGFMELPLSHLPTGMHIIAVNINGSVKVVKVIK